MRKTSSLSIVALIACLAISILTPIAAQATGAANVAQPLIVSADPANFTPNIQDGIVNAIVQVGNQIIVGGSFTQAKNRNSTDVIPVQNILAFDANTGAINTNFLPTFDGEILTLGTDGTSVYVGGSFATVNGVTGTYKRLVKLDPANGQIVTAFKPKFGSGAGVYDMSFANGRLYIGGAFSSIQNTPRERLAALDPVTAALDPTLNIVFAGQHNGGTVRVHRMDISPDGSKLVAIGNFLTADGLNRRQVAMINLQTNPPAVANWQTSRYEPACASRFDTYMRDVDFAPSGDYFVIGTTGAWFGGPGAGVLCDTVSRWATGATGTALQPQWVDYTGGDTTFSVTATNTAVYVGGHQRWWNNPFRGDAPGPGATERTGIGALDPVNGLPFAWNPIREPRGLGVQMMLATPQGLWVGSDTDNIGGEFHGKIALMPLDGGSAVPSPYVATLPNDLYTLPLSGCLSADPSVLYRVNAGGSAVPSGSCAIDWAVDTTATPSSLHNTGSSAVNGGSVSLHSSIPAGTPTTLFSTAREDPSGGNEMQWALPVQAGKQVKVRLYFANQDQQTRKVGDRIFNVAIDGTTVLPNFDIVAAFGHRVGGMREFNVTSDGQIDIAFTHVKSNPLVNAVEVIDPNASGGGGATGFEYLGRRSFTGTTSGTATSVLTPGTDWSHARGSFVTNGKLYTGWDTGVFSSRPFDGTNVGPATAIDLHGLTSSYWPVASLTGMFFLDGRIYYTVANDARLYSRYFTPESEVVGAETFTASGVSDGLNWSTVSGMTYAQGAIYFARTNGNLYRMSFANGVPTPGTETLLSGPSVGDGKTWNSRGMFIYGQVVDNFAPSAPGKPSGISNTISSIDLTWGASSDNVSTSLNYHVFRDGVDIATVPSSSTTTVSYSDTGLDPGSSHTYRVTAVDDANLASNESPVSDTIVVQVPDTTPPQIPGPVTATAHGKTAVDLTWPASSDDRGGPITYRIYRDGSQAGSITSGSTTTVSFTDQGLQPGSTHTYTVDAVDLSGNASDQSAPSNEVTTAGNIFVDRFDSGDFANWTSNTRFTIDAATGATSPPSATASPTAQTAMLTKDLGADYTTLCVSATFNVAARGTSTLDLIRLRTAANGGIGKAFLNANGNLVVKSDVSNTTRNSNVLLPAGWHAVEICGNVGTASTWDLYLDGNPIVTGWVADTGTTPISRFTLGDNTGKTFTLNVDDVVVDAFPG